jgi:hypothetical protein
LNIRHWDIDSSFEFRHSDFRMPTLVFEHDGHQRAGALNGRVLIGRRLSHGVVIADPAVSRLHAWIDNREGTFVLTDAGSRTGTFVNGNAIVRYELQHGDTIQIGPATVKYLDDAAVSDGAPAGLAGLEMLDLASPLAMVDSSKQGILFDCACGAPLWVAAKFAGKRGLCKYCGEPVKVPMLARPAPSPAAKAFARSALQTTAGPSASASTGAVARLPGESARRSPRPRPPAPMPSCGVCHASIEPAEETTTCPDCGTKFHADCWMENYGCSSYGCAQVDAVKPASVAVAEAAQAAAAQAAAQSETAPPPATLPVGTIALAAAIIASLVGAVLFGVFSLAVAGGVGFVLLRQKPARQRGLLIAALVVALLGAAIGLAVSDFMWLDGRHLPAMLR